jgi:hypothetical protein
MRRHFMDLPAPVDDIHLLCGEKLEEGSRRLRGEHVTGTVELVNCIPCLRAYAAKQLCEINSLKNRAEPPPLNASQLAELRGLAEHWKMLAEDEEDAAVAAARKFCATDVLDRVARWTALK